MFKPDQPISTTDDDLLQRSPFAKSLAESFVKYEDSHSIVTGLYGKWGSGKSSVINMCIEHIEELANELPKKEKPIVIKFNPWNYSDQNQLISQFFKQLSLALKRTDFGEDAIKAADQLEAYAEFFEPLALIPEPSLGLLAAATSKVMKRVGFAARKWGELKKKDLEATRKDLDRILEKQKRKIVIIIDDIDRLNSTEIRQMFQLVKLLGDFPNTIYLLAFDREVVVESLKSVQEGVGEEYLEKIVQIPFELPIIDKQEVERLLCSQIDELISDIPEEGWDSTYWGNIFHSGLNKFFFTLRDVTRYINALRFGLGPVKEEVNPVDFLAITAIQVFEPDVYKGIRENKGVFSGLLNDSYRSADAEKQQAKIRCDEIISRTKRISEKELKEFLTRMFPKLEGIYNNHGYGGGFLDTWRREGRICSPDKFDTFFRLALAPGEVSEQEIKTILSLGNDEKAFAEMLLHLKEDGRVVRFLERMEDYTREVIPEENITPIVNVLMNIGDNFPEGPRGFYSTDTPMRVLRIMYQLSQRYEQQDRRFELFKEAITKAEDSLYTIVHEVGVQGQHHGKRTSKSAEQVEPEENRPVNAKQLEELESIACQKIQEWAKIGKLKDHSHLISILYSWKHWCENGEDEARSYVKGMIDTDEGVVTLVAAFVGKSYSHAMTDYVSRENWRINLDSINDFISVEELEKKARAIIAAENFSDLLSDKQKSLTTLIDTIDGKISD